MGDSEEAPGSWFWSGSALAVVNVCGVNQQIKDLGLSLFLFVTLSFKYNKHFLREGNIRKKKSHDLIDEYCFLNCTGSSKTGLKAMIVRIQTWLSKMCL